MKLAKAKGGGRREVKLASVWWLQGGNGFSGGGKG